MLRKVGLTAFSTVLFFLSISPLPLLALKLAVPTRSSDGKSIFLSWTEDAGDPETVYLQINCLPILIFIPHDRLMAQVSSHSISFEADPKITTATSPVDCKLYAYTDLRSWSPISQIDTFQTLQVAPPPPTPPVVAPSSTPPEPKPMEPKHADPSVPESAPATTTPTTPHPSGAPPPTKSPFVGNGSSISTTSKVPNKPFPGTATFSASSDPIPPMVPGPMPTGPAPPEAERGPSPHMSSRGAIIGGVIGGLALLALLLGLGFLYCRRRRDRLAPSAAYRVANDNDSYGSMDDTDRQVGQFRPDVKHSTDHNTAENGARETEVEGALRRKAEILDDLKFEAAAREGVKAR